MDDRQSPALEIEPIEGEHEAPDGVSSAFEGAARHALERGEALGDLASAVYRVDHGCLRQADRAWRAGDLISAVDWLDPTVDGPVIASRRTWVRCVRADVIRDRLAAQLPALIRAVQRRRAPICARRFGLLALGVLPPGWPARLAAALGAEISTPARLASDHSVARWLVPLAPDALDGLAEVDAVILVCPAATDPRPGAAERALWRLPAARRPPIHLILLHDPAVDHPTGTRRWYADRDLAGHLHARRDRPGDLARIGRLLTGRGVGLVLGGGGALGSMHLGVFKALGDHGVPIDAVGGTSSGGGIAAQMAMGLDFPALQRCNYDHFFKSNPFRRPTLPLMAVTPRQTVDAVARSLYGLLDIEDLWLPFFCVSTNLTRSTLQVHRSGPVWRAVRATTAVPGLATPFVEDGDVLVDGGLLCTLPTRQMRGRGVGRVIAVDVLPLQSARGLGYDYDALPGALEALIDRLRPGGEAARIPSLPYVITRSTALADAQDRAANRAAADLLFTPPAEGARSARYVGFDAMVSRAYADATALLATLGPGERARLHAPPAPLRPPSEPAPVEPRRARRGLLGRLPRFDISIHLK